jgi:hypothetical protein
MQQESYPFAYEDESSQVNTRTTTCSDGAFRGSYALPPLTNEQLREYVNYYMVSPNDSRLPENLRGNISIWNVSEVTDMARLFANMEHFNEELEWNTERVTDMKYMFYECTRFNKPVNFNTKNVVFMNHMFTNCIAFDQEVPFDTTLVYNMEFMFAGCIKFNRPLAFVTNNVTRMTGMCLDCVQFNQEIHFNNFNTTNLDYMFANCTNLNKPVYFTYPSWLRHNNTIFYQAYPYDSTFENRRNFLYLKTMDDSYHETCAMMHCEIYPDKNAHISKYLFGHPAYEIASYMGHYDHRSLNDNAPPIVPERIHINGEPEYDSDGNPYYDYDYYADFDEMDDPQIPEYSGCDKYETKKEEEERRISELCDNSVDQMEDCYFTEMFHESLNIEGKVYRKLW